MTCQIHDFSTWPDLLRAACDDFQTAWIMRQLLKKTSFLTFAVLANRPFTFCRLHFAFSVQLTRRHATKTSKNTMTTWRHATKTSQNDITTSRHASKTSQNDMTTSRHANFTSQLYAMPASRQRQLNKWISTATKRRSIYIYIYIYIYTSFWAGAI